MPARRFIEIDGKRHLWRTIVRLRQEQRRAFAKADQSPLPGAANFALLDR